MVTEPTAPTTHWILGLEKHFAATDWPWVIRALRHDQVVWEALALHGLAKRGLTVLPGNPEQWSPAVLGLLSIDLTAPLESLRTLPLRPVSQSVHERAQQALDEWTTNQGATPLTLGKAVLIALALRESRVASAWEKVFLPMDFTHPEWKTVFTCLYGLIPDPFDMLRALLQDSADKFYPRIAVHALLSNPLKADELRETLHDLLKELKVQQRKQVLQVLGEYCKELSVEIAQKVLDDQLTRLQPAASATQTGAAKAAEQAWVNRLDSLRSALQIAELHITAGQEEAALPYFSDAITSTRRLQAEFSARLAELVSMVGNPASAVEAWRQAAQMDPENAYFTAGLVEALMSNERIEDARTLLDLHVAQLDGSVHPVLWLVEAQLASVEGHMQDAREAAEKAYEHLGQTHEIESEKHLLQLGHTLLTAGLPSQAAMVADRCLKINPNHAQALVLQARAYLAAGKNTAALTAASLATTLQPGENAPEELLLACLEACKEWPAALAVRQHLLERRANTPTSADLHALAGCALNSHEPHQAVSASQKALSIDPQDGIAHALYGAALLQLNDPEAALTHFSTATELSPHKAEPWLALADAYQHSGESSHAYEILRSGSLAAPHSARLQLALGKASLEAGAPSQALSTLRKAASLLQENPADEKPILSAYGYADISQEVAFNLGETLRQLGHLDEANQVFSAAYEATAKGKPVDMRLSYAFGKTLLGLNAISKAVAPLLDVVGQNPTDPEPYVDLAHSLLQLSGPMRDYASRAVEYLTKALQLNPALAEAQGLLGEALEAKHEPSKALVAYQKALETPLKEDAAWRARLHHGVGRAALQIGQADTALISLREAAQLEPLEPAIQQSLAAACMELEMYDGSLSAARTALQLTPSQPQLMQWFAQHTRHLYSATSGQVNALTEAAQALTQAIQSDPAQIELYIDLGQLYLENENPESALRAFIEAADKTITAKGGLSLPQLLLLARQLRHLNQAEKATVLLTQGLQDYQGTGSYDVDQDRPETQLWYELSITHLQIGNPEAAIQALDQAIRCQPDNPNLLIKKADVLVECECLQEAMEILEQVLNQSPEDISLHIKAAQVLRYLGEYQSAFAHAKLAARLQDLDAPQSTFLKSHSLAAQLARSLLMPDQALELIGTEKPDTEDHATLVDFLNTRLEIAFDFQDENMQSATISQLEELNPVDPRSLASLARSALRNGNTEQANQLLNQSLRWIPDDKQGATHIEMLLIQRSQAEAALELGKWSLAVPLFRHIANQLIDEPLTQFQLARALVLEAEFVPFAQQAGSVEHAPQTPSSKNIDEFSHAIAKIEKYGSEHKINPSGRSHYCLEALARWKARGETIFKPGPDSSMALDAAFESIPAQPDDIAARILLLGNIHEVTTASRAAQLYPRNPLVWSRQAAVLAETNPHQALSAIHRALDNWNSQAAEYRYEYPLLLALQAKLAYETGEREQAAGAIQLALSHWPNEPRWHALKAEIELDLALETRNDHNQREAGILSAVNHLEKAVELEPEEYTHALKLGQVYLWRGALIQAIRALQRAIQIAPEEAEIWYSLAQAQRCSGNLEEARVSAEKALEKSSDPTSVHLLLAEIELDTNNARAAHTRIQGILDANPEHPKALHILALTLEKINRPAEALSTLEKLIHLSQAPFALELERARIMEKAQGVKSSITALQEIVERYPEEPLALAGLARALLNDGQVSPAVEAAQKALVHNKGQLDQIALADLNQRIGHHALTGGQLDLAVHHLTLAVELDPNSLEAYLDLGATYLERRQPNYALQVFNQAIALVHDDYRPYYQAGLALKELKDYQAAEEMLNRASKLAPTEIGIHRLLTAVVALNLIHNRRSADVSHYTEGLK